MDKESEIYVFTYHHSVVQCTARYKYSHKIPVLSPHTSLRLNTVLSNTILGQPLEQFLCI